MAYEGRAPALPSVLLAYELYLPLAIAGLGLGSGVPHLWPDGLVIYAINLAWGALLGAVTLAILGFRPLTLVWLYPRRGYDPVMRDLAHRFKRSRGSSGRPGGFADPDPYRYIHIHADRNHHPYACAANLHANPHAHTHCHYPTHGNAHHHSYAGLCSRAHGRREGRSPA